MLQDVAKNCFFLNKGVMHDRDFNRVRGNMPDPSCCYHNFNLDKVT